MSEKDINGKLGNLSKQYRQKYGIAVFSVEVKETKSGMRLSGAVLAENQKDEILNLMRNNGIKISGEKIAVLSDGEQRNEIGWGIVKKKITDLKSRFVSNKIINKRILKRIRCSQAFQGEILRVLFKKEDQLLVQQSDLTLGWIDKKNIVTKKENLWKKWRNGNFAMKDRLIKINNKKAAHRLNGFDRAMEPIPLILKEAEKYLNVKYVLGGRSEKGIDCSGFVQVVYKNSLDIILPKHSWDQKKIGLKIEFEETESGDLIFLIKKKNSHKHVGIVGKKGSNIDLIHASLDKRRVVKESLNKVFENYDFVEVRRIIE